MKIATWNVNSIRIRLPLVLEWLSSSDIDVALLQETKVQDALFPREPFEDLGYNIALHGQKTYNGVAILSKYPLEDVKIGLPSLKGPDHARYIEAFTAGFRVASLYVPNGQEIGCEAYQYKERFFQALSARTEKLLTYDEHLVLGGDYNVAPSDADVYDETKWRDRILCSTPERKWLRTLRYLGLIDPLDQVSEGSTHKNPFTWWDYRRQAFDLNRGLRIDHLLLSPQAADSLSDIKVEEAWRAREKPSDHTPVMATFRSHS